MILTDKEKLMYIRVLDETQFVNKENTSGFSKKQEVLKLICGLNNETDNEGFLNFSVIEKKFERLNIKKIPKKEFHEAISMGQTYIFILNETAIAIHDFSDKACFYEYTDDEIIKTKINEIEIDDEILLYDSDIDDYYPQSIFDIIVIENSTVNNNVNLDDYFNDKQKNNLKLSNYIIEERNTLIINNVLVSSLL
jgi:hypothetical protein